MPSFGWQRRRPERESVPPTFQPEVRDAQSRFHE